MSGIPVPKNIIARKMPRICFAATGVGPFIALVLAFVVVCMRLCDAGEPHPVNDNKNAPQVQKPSIADVWVSCDRWPCFRTLEAAGQDILRIEKPKTEEEKALAVYKWLQRVMWRGSAPSEGPYRAEQAPLFDNLKHFLSHSYGYCDTWARAGSALMTAAGLQGERIEAYGDPHLQVWYKDADGVERGHFFGPFRGYWVSTRDGLRIASYADTMADKSLFIKPTRHSSMYFKRPCDYQWCDLDKTTKMQDVHWRPEPRAVHKTDVLLRPGESYNFTTEREGPDFYVGFWSQFIPRGADSVIRTTDHSTTRNGAGDELFRGDLGPDDPKDQELRERFNWKKGTLRDPDNAPFWKPYLFAENSGGPKIWRGLTQGWTEYAARIAPDFADDLAEPAQNIAFADGMLRPEAVGKPAVLVFKISGPYILTAAEWQGMFLRKTDGDTIEVQLSRFYNLPGEFVPVWNADKTGEIRFDFTDGLDRWRTGQDSDKLPKMGQTAAVPLKERTESMHGRYGYLVKIAMKAATDPKSVGLKSLRLKSWFQNNPFVLPLLQPGENVISVDGKMARGAAGLKLDYVWSEKGGEPKTKSWELKSLPSTVKLDVGGTTPEDVRVIRIRIEAIRAGAK